MDCDNCRFTICPDSCPYAMERTKMYECLECGENIYDGDEYYRIYDDSFCQDCIEEMRILA